MCVEANHLFCLICGRSRDWGSSVLYTMYEPIKFFSRVHVILYDALSVGSLVGRLVGRSVADYEEQALFDFILVFCFLSQRHSLFCCKPCRLSSQTLCPVNSVFFRTQPSLVCRQPCCFCPQHCFFCCKPCCLAQCAWIFLLNLASSALQNSFLC